MALPVKDDVVGLEISEDDVPFVKVLDGQNDLTQVVSRSLLIEPPVLVQGSAHVSPLRIVQQQKQLLRRLESVLQPHYVRVLGV